MVPGDFFAASTRSFTLLYGPSARTARTVGSAVNRAMGTSWFSWYMGSRPSTLSASGMIEIDESAMRIV